MPQKLLRFDSTPSTLDVLGDVVIDNPQDFDILVRLGTLWKNKNISSVFLSAFSLKASTYDDNFTAITNSINIVNTDNNPVNCNLPLDPELGDRLIFVDFNTNSPQNEDITGWGQNAVTLLPPFNTYVEGRPTAVLNNDRGYFEFMYMPGNNWVNILRSPKDDIQIIETTPYTVFPMLIGSTVVYTGAQGAFTMDITPLEDAGGHYFNFINLSSQNVTLTTTNTIRYSNNDSNLLSVQYRSSKILYLGTDWVVT